MVASGDVHLGHLVVERAAQEDVGVGAQVEEAVPTTPRLVLGRHVQVKEAGEGEMVRMLGDTYRGKMYGCMIKIGLIVPAMGQKRRRYRGVMYFDYHI